MMMTVCPKDPQDRLKKLNNWWTGPCLPTFSSPYVREMKRAKPEGKGKEQANSIPASKRDIERTELTDSKQTFCLFLHFHLLSFGVLKRNPPRVYRCLLLFMHLCGGEEGMRVSLAKYENNNSIVLSNRKVFFSFLLSRRRKEIEEGGKNGTSGIGCCFVCWCFPSVVVAQVNWSFYNSRHRRWILPTREGPHWYSARHLFRFFYGVWFVPLAYPLSLSLYLVPDHLSSLFILLSSLFFFFFSSLLVCPPPPTLFSYYPCYYISLPFCPPLLIVSFQPPIDWFSFSLSILIHFFTSYFLMTSTCYSPYSPLSTLQY